MWLFSTFCKKYGKHLLIDIFMELGQDDLIHAKQVKANYINDTLHDIHKYVGE